MLHSCTDAKARGQIFIDRIDFVIVVRLDENVTDQDARQDRAERELKISVVPKGETFAGRSKKCSRARFRRDERSENGPPCDLAAAEGEVFEAFFLSAHVKADGNDQNEVKEENCGIDREPSVHVGA